MRRPITFAELQNLTKDQLQQLISVCCKHKWKLKEPRCECIGIWDVSFQKNEKLGRATGCEWEISWSDADGDPTLYLSDLSTKIDGFTCDGRWFYGLYMDE